MTATEDREPLLAVNELIVEYGRGKARFAAVAGVSLTVSRGESVGIVGESGCGKSSLGRSILQLQRPASGSVLLDGRELTELSQAALREVRSRMQVVLQDPISALNPRRQVLDIVAEGLVIHGRDKATARRAAADMLRRVGLHPELVGNRKPHQFSGGQCQRIAIARAMVLDPELLVCDEPVASLDVSVQAQVLTILLDLKARSGLAMIFISHDLSVVMNVCDRVVVMYLGKVVEEGTAEQISRAPQHPYTRILLDSVPKPDPAAPHTEPAIRGEIPSPRKPPSGCRFRTRCPAAQALCEQVEPELAPTSCGGSVACHFPLLPAEDGAGLKAGC